MRLFTEEVDKITSLVIGLSSRLAKASLGTNNQQDEKLLVTMMTMVVVMMRLLLITKQRWTATLMVHMDFSLKVLMSKKKGVVLKDNCKRRSSLFPWPANMVRRERVWPRHG